MPLLPFDRNFIDVPVSDRVPGVKQNARWLQMLAKQDPLTGIVTVQLHVLVSQTDEAGEALTGKGIVTYNVPLNANNASAVDPETGEVKYMQGSETDAQWLAMLNSQPEPLLLQGDWMAGVMRKMGITPLIHSFMVQADQPPFSKFS